MLPPFRTLPLLLLVILLGWQGVAVAHHKGEHPLEHNVHHECVLCALGMPAIDADIQLPVLGSNSASDLSDHQRSLTFPPPLTPNARAPPPVNHLYLSLKD